MSAFPFFANAHHASHIRRAGGPHRCSAEELAAAAAHREKKPQLHRSHSSAARLGSTGAIQKEAHHQHQPTVGGGHAHHGGAAFHAAKQHDFSKSEPASPGPSSPGPPQFENGGASMIVPREHFNLDIKIHGAHFTLNTLKFSSSALRSGIVDALQSFGRYY